ncbi:hypothetical protein P280DRAFT_90975 [Massarina eburnea CBS 473.64]|uniref:Uncharacterized protein n=1 Tax=Massarina eburnea CBS 473.64 TaxID=1395130 RepID=A0A6A6RRL7_9PLEO|nr:hypothetical protein P280DRAFT_90975 [Massarina eburnea CBS 473.64]
MRFKNGYLVDFMGIEVEVVLQSEPMRRPAGLLKVQQASGLRLSHVALDVRYHVHGCISQAALADSEADILGGRFLQARKGLNSTRCLGGFEMSVWGDVAEARCGKWHGFWPRHVASAMWASCEP